MSDISGSVYQKFDNYDNIFESAEKTAQKYNERGTQIYNKKDYKTAIYYFTKAINTDPKCSVFYSNRAAAYMSLNKFEYVLEDINTSINLDPQYIKAHNRKFSYYLLHYDLRKCEDCLIKIKDLDIKNYENCLNKLNEIKLKKNYLDKALENQNYRDALFYIECLLKISNQSIELKLLKAEILIYLKRAEEIINTLNLNFIKTYYKSEFYFIQGLKFFYEFKVEESLQLLQAALRLEPEHIKAQKVYKKAKTFNQLKKDGNTLLNENNFKEASKLYLQALEVDPLNTFTNSRIYFNLSLVYGKQNEIKNAIENCTKAIKFDNNYIKALVRRANLYESLEMYEESAQDYKTVYEKNGTEVYNEYYKEALMRTKHKNYYRILGISDSADSIEIKKAYKKQAMDHHPDRHANLLEHEKKLHEKKFKEAGEAYTILSDPVKRKNYDFQKNNSHNIPFIYNLSTNYFNFF